MLKTKATQNEFSSPNNSCNDKDHLVFLRLIHLKKAGEEINQNVLKQQEKNSLIVQIIVGMIMVISFYKNCTIEKGWRRYKPKYVVRKRL